MRLGGGSGGQGGDDPFGGGGGQGGDEEFDKSLGDFDREMGREQGEIAKEGGGPAADSGSQRGGAGGGEGGEGGEAGGNGGNAEGGGGDGTGSAGAPARDLGPDTAAVATVAGCNDQDRVARQLCEAATEEKDPFLRGALWDEYNEYKKLVARD